MSVGFLSLMKEPQISKTLSNKLMDPHETS